MERAPKPRLDPSEIEVPSHFRPLQALESLVRRLGVQSQTTSTYGNSFPVLMASPAFLMCQTAALTCQFIFVAKMKKVCTFEVVDHLDRRLVLLGTPSFATAFPSVAIKPKMTAGKS